MGKLHFIWGVMNVFDEPDQTERLITPALIWCTDDVGHDTGFCIAFAWWNTAFAVGVWWIN